MISLAANCWEICYSLSKKVGITREDLDTEALRSAC